MKKERTEAHGHEVPSAGRRRAMKHLVWAAPAVVATAALKARAQEESGVLDPGDGDGGCPPP